MRRLFLALLLSLAATAAHADGDAKAGAQKIKSLQCQGCHGKDGLSKLPGAPNLAGQAQDYLVSALQAYRSEDRKNEIMNTVAKTLKDDDINDLTAYYSALQITVKPPAP